MKIAIIYHSLTGQTRKLAQLMQSKLTQAGHQVTMTELKTNIEQKSGTIRQQMKFEVTNLPDLNEFDAICMGGPVWAFGPSTVAYKAILQMQNINGKKALPFVTMGFPFKGMGGKGAIKHMSKALTEKGAVILPGIIIPKMFRNFELLMAEASDQSVGYFG